MSLASPRTLTVAWTALIGVTAASFGSAELLSPRWLAVALILAIVAVKAVIILVRFMDIRAAPSGIRWYMAAWTLVCCAAIFVLYIVPGASA